MQASIRKRILFLSMAILLTICFVSCTGAKDNVSNPVSDSSKDESTSEYDDYGRLYIEDNIPDDLDFDGETVNILVRQGALYELEFWASELNGEILNDAIFERNSEVEEDLNINIVTTILEPDSGKYAPTNFNEKVRTAIETGTAEFDIVASNAYYGVVLGNQGYFLNLYDLNYIDFDKTWWNDDFINEMTINDKLFFAVGDASFTSLDLACATFYNKELLNQYGGENLYEKVDSGEWTIDYFSQLVKQIYKDLNGDGTRDDGDFYGIGMATASSPLDALFAGFNLSVTSRDEEGMPILDFYNDQNASFFDKMYEVLFNNNGVLPGQYTNESINLMFEKFQNEETVFVMSIIR